MTTQAGRKPVILTCIGAFWPGNDSSGPNQSIMGLARALGGEFDFLQVSRDRPFGEETPLAKPGVWIDRVYARVRYCEPSRFGARGLKHILCNETYDLVLLNGFFDREYTMPILQMRKLGLIPRKPTILSPRGEFSQGALALKPRRKAIYIEVARAAGLLSDICLHATNEAELRDIKTAFPWAGSYACVANVRPLLPLQPHRPCDASLRLAFVGRISQVKNLNFALQALRSVTSKVTFNIHGPVEDAVYWDACGRTISSLPQNVTVNYKGAISNGDLPAMFAECDLLYLPSVSENFGHAIFEALSCGVPVLIGDQTPWKNLREKGAGWDLPLGKTEPFTFAIDELAAMSEAQRERLREGARALAVAYVSEGTAVKDTIALFDAMLKNAGATSQHKAA